MNKCGQCGHENDPTRVFCQNCGTRLEVDESAGPAATPGPRHTPVPVKRSSVKKGKGMTPAGALWRLARGVLSTAFLAAILATFVQFARVPDDVPEAKPGDPRVAERFIAGVRTFASSPYPRTMDLKQESLNNYLQSRLTAAPTDGSDAISGTRFGRAFVVVDDGTFHFYVERRHLGMSIYVGAECSVQAGPGGAAVTVLGGSIGRMPIHPAIFGLVMGRIISPAVTALGEPLELLKGANRVTLQPGVVLMGWPGKVPPR